MAKKLREGEDIGIRINFRVQESSYWWNGFLSTGAGNRSLLSKYPALGPLWENVLAHPEQDIDALIVEQLDPIAGNLDLLLRPAWE